VGNKKDRKSFNAGLFNEEICFLEMCFIKKYGIQILSSPIVFADPILESVGV
jgi:hypothetical protein